MQVQNIVALIKGLQDKRVNPKELTPHLRKKVVLHFINEQSEISNVQLAALLGLSDAQISRIRSGLMASAAWELKEVDIDRLAVSLKKHKEEYQRRAVSRTRVVPIGVPVFDKEGRRIGFETNMKEVPDPDFRLAWDIEVEYIDKMAELGYIRKAPKELAVGLFDLRGELEKFFDEYDVRNPAEFAAILRAAAGGNGRGARALLPVSVRPCDAGRDNDGGSADGPGSAVPPGSQD